ncbi:MAG: methyltransferase domain-containing protein [bacterium]|nr:methyltransferase domain-containing protein [bacterium]
MNQDTKEALFLHKNRIKQKDILNKVYIDFYNHFKASSVPGGLCIELGSGGGFLKEIIPDVITSDLLEAPGIDKIFPATEIPYSADSVSAFFMLNVLHHIKNSEKAIQEMERSLKIGGKIIMIEPINSMWGRIIYKYIHKEKFDPKAGWRIEGEGRMSDSNIALPWILFVRDRKIFEKRFPHLKIIKIYYHSPFKYLFSGGLSNFQFLPTIAYPLIRRFDDIVSRIFPEISMFVTVEIEKI